MWPLAHQKIPLSISPVGMLGFQEATLECMVLSLADSSVPERPPQENEQGAWDCPCGRFFHPASISQINLFKVVLKSLNFLKSFLFFFENFFFSFFAVLAWGSLDTHERSASPQSLCQLEKRPLEKRCLNLLTL
eukprot:sb/3474775/